MTRYNPQDMETFKSPELHQTRRLGIAALRGALLRRLYRVYYTTYDDELHARALEELRKTYGNNRVIEHKSMVLPEFRFIEVLVDKEGEANKIAEIVRRVVGVDRVKVDWIDTSR